jgi:hypothetical protein
MFSKEFMRFLYSYQKDDFKPKEPVRAEIKFKNKGGGKLAEVLVPETNKG